MVYYHDKHPLQGYRRLAFMMLDDDVVAAIPSTVYRVLRTAGRLDRWNGKPSKKGTGFVQPLCPHEMLRSYAVPISRPLLWLTVVGALATAATAATAAEPPELPEIQRPSVPEPAEPEAEPEPDETATDPPAEDQPEDTSAEVEPEPTETETGPPPPEPSTACACDELDWVCRQNEPACSSGAPRPAVAEPEPTDASEPTVPPASVTTTKTREPEVELDPQGLVLGLGAGVGGCRQEICVENPLSLLGHVALGYRLPRVAFMANATFGGGTKTDDDGGVVLVEVDAGIEWFLASTERVDPYISAGLGYMLVLEVYTDYMTDSTDTARISRGAARVGAGLPFRLRKGWSLGPRFDYRWGFLGKRCFGSCTPISEIIDDVGSDRVARREERQTFPRPWSLMLEFRKQF